MKKREIYKRIMGLSLGLCLAFSLNMSANAQTCTAAPSCDSLGYTKSASDCTGEYLKCPFDNNKVFCGSSSSSCGGSGTSGDNGASLAVGDILYSDKTTNANLIIAKTPIGVVFDVTNRLAVALTETSKTWGATNSDITTLTNCGGRHCDIDGKSNTQKIIAWGTANSLSHQAAEYCNSYTTEGTSAGDWWLPSLLELNLLYSKKAAVNTGLSQMGYSLTDNAYWSSTEYNNYHARGLNMTDGYAFSNTKDYTYVVRPVTSF